MFVMYAVRANNNVFELVENEGVYEEFEAEVIGESFGEVEVATYFGDATGEERVYIVKTAAYELGRGIYVLAESIDALYC